MSNDIKKEIIFLQGLTNRKLYEQGIELFKLKYSQFSVTRTFLSKFSKCFIEKNNNWQEPYDVFAPSTNNALERFNLLVKDKYFKWNRLNMTNFFDISFKILNDFGEVYPSFEKVFYTNEEVIEHQFNFTVIKQFNVIKLINVFI